MLRRIARGRLMVTMIEGKRAYCYEDGSRCDQRAAQRLIREAWVVPGDGPLFAGEEPQSWVIPEKSRPALPSQDPSAPPLFP